ncbi:MAG TPA: M28 family peptidase, partial [Sedimentisphaerales bacterium]|nr:M28 family peptidase [Sedimentisphaerales bacterium]
MRRLQTDKTIASEIRIQGRCGLPVCAVLLAVLLTCFLPASVRGSVPAIDRRLFDADMAELMRNPNRLAGREDGSRAASIYVEKRLREMGIDEVYVQEFPVVMPRMTECEIEVDGKRHPMNAIQPNLLQASVTPEEGITGQSIYVGRGTAAEYGVSSVDGMIVFMDFDSGRNWIDAFAFGARAVVFIGDYDVVTNSTHFLNISANLPRFHITREQAVKLGVMEESKTVTLYAAAQWERLEGRNVIGVIRASNESTEPVEERPAIVLAAGLDSFSVVPEMSPGARDAANIAILLQTAGELVRNRPDRDVVVAFLDGQRQSNLGGRAFYGALFRRHRARRVARWTLDQRLSMLQAEQADMEGISQILSLPDFPSPALADSLDSRHYNDALRALLA